MAKPSETSFIHNHIRHGVRTRSGVNGFRAYQLRECKKLGLGVPDSKYAVCRCGWRPDLGTHYRFVRETDTLSRRRPARKRTAPVHVGNRIDASAPTDCLSLHEVARQLRMSVKTASRRIDAGDFPPHIKIGRLILFRRQAIDAWLRARESATGVAPHKRTRKGA